jgi:hypothetical protein
VDGVVHGFWRRNRAGDDMRIDVEHVLPAGRGRARELRTAVERVREIFSADVSRPRQDALS